MDISLGKVLRVSYIINALNAIVGFGGFIGAGVRAMVYKTIRMIKEIGSLYFINTDFNVDWFKFVIIVNRIPRFDASLILNKITWVRWVLYAVSLFYHYLLYIQWLDRLIKQSLCRLILYISVMCRMVSRCSCIILLWCHS